MGDVHIIHFLPLFNCDGLDRTLIDGHGIAHKTVLFLELGVELVELVHRRRRALLKSLLEEIARAL